MEVLARIRPRFVGHAVLPSNWREAVRQLVENTCNLRLPLLDKLLGHLTRIKVVRLAAQLASELELPWAELAQQHSRRLGGGRRWVAVGRTGERLDWAATP